MFHNYETEKVTRKAMMRQKTCNYIELFVSSARDRHARRIQCYYLNVGRSCMTISGGRTEQLDIIAGFLLRHWLYELFSSAENVRQYI